MRARFIHVHRVGLGVAYDRSRLWHPDVVWPGLSGDPGMVLIARVSHLSVLILFAPLPLKFLAFPIDESSSDHVVMQCLQQYPIWQTPEAQCLEQGKG